MVQKKIILSYGIHNAQEVIFLAFDKDYELISKIKTIPFVRWSATNKKWYIPKDKFNLKIVLNSINNSAYIDYKAILNNNKNEIKKGEKISQINKEKISEFTLWLKHKRYSNNTIKTYIEALKRFIYFIEPKPIELITNDDFIIFVNDYIIKNFYSFSYQNQVINAIKLFFKEIVKSEVDVNNIKRPRREHKLPNVLSKEEVKAIIDAPKNLKHRTMLSLIYACGLRRSELLNLKITDIESKRNLLLVKNSKGNKDRIVPISDKIIIMLREYYKAYRPKIWLFEGQNIGERYSEESLAKVLKQACKKAKITKPVTLHWLRHSYATHLLESGTDLRYIQELLGHKSSRTTEIYTHVTEKSIQKIKSPFDDL